MKVQDVMTQHVISVGPSDSMARAIRAMLQNDISGLPVLDTGGRLVAMVTEGDLLRRAETATQRRVKKLAAAEGSTDEDGHRDQDHPEKEVKIGGYLNMM